MKKIIRVPLSMTAKEIIKEFCAGDRYEPDPTGMAVKNLVSDFRDYVFKLERFDGSIVEQKIEKYPFICYLIRDPDTNRYFDPISLSNYLISLR